MALQRPTETHAHLVCICNKVHAVFSGANLKCKGFVDDVLSPLDRQAPVDLHNHVQHGKTQTEMSSVLEACIRPKLDAIVVSHTQRRNNCLRVISEVKNFEKSSVFTFVCQSSPQSLRVELSPVRSIGSFSRQISTFSSN